nr:MAG TPA: chromosome replication initiation protein [Bacteriophage sp.]
MAKIKNENFIAIQGFMVKELGLTGNELIAYALVYGFSQDDESEFKGSLNYVAEWLNCSRTTAFNLLNKLADDGFIKKTEKTINGVKFCNYSATKPNNEELKEIKLRKQIRKEREKLERSSKKLNTCSKNHNGCSKNLNEGVQKVDTHNNNIDNIKDNISETIGEVHTSTNIDGEVHTSVSEKQMARVTRQDMQAKKDDMLYRFSEICDNSIENKTIGEVVKNAFCRYMNLYETYFCKVHPILTDKTLTNVCLSLSNVTDTEHNHFEGTDVYLTDETGLTGLDRMVNEHFRRTHRRETNYSITHFAKSDYLLQLAQGIIEY